jgi:hypothetical protein
MEPLNRIRARSLRLFFAVVFVPVLLFALANQAPAQAPFDFSLSARGPHNVVQGRDLYIKVTGTTLSGDCRSLNTLRSELR